MYILIISIDFSSPLPPGNNPIAVNKYIIIIIIITNM